VSHLFLLEQFNTVAGVMGNVLEWYDFALFGFFSDIIAQVFFPPGPDNLIKSFAIFGGAFIMRPVGGVIIGYVGDKYGRKVALTHSLFLMAIPTFAMGFLPTYEQVGGWAPFLLVVCRLFQGISVGGQLPASLVYTVERHPKEHWGFYGSLPMVAANIGGALGNLMGATLRSVLTEEQLVSFGWRIPFYSGILIGFVAFYLKYYGEDVPLEPPEYHNPLVAACRPSNRLPLVCATLTSILWAGGIYVSVSENQNPYSPSYTNSPNIWYLLLTTVSSMLKFVWMAIFMETLLEPSIPGAFWVNLIADLLGVTVMLPIAGIVSDKYGRIKVMTIAAVCSFVWGPIAIFIIGSTTSPFLACFVQWMLGLCMAFFGAPLCAWLVETVRLQLFSWLLQHLSSHTTYTFGTTGTLYSTYYRT
jgi:MHS family proline/betaine transporter-like MFS transporter